MSVLFIKDLIIEAKHGVNPEERVTPQRFQINLEMTVDTDRASDTDDLNDTVNWSGVRKTIIHTVQSTSFYLMERLAKEIADKVLVDKNINKVVIDILKLDAFETGAPGIRAEYTQH